MDANLLILTLVVLISSVLSVPIKEEQLFCAPSCKPDPSFISYGVESTYVYDYESVTAIGLSGTDVQPIELKARIEISSHFPCEMSLRLRQVQINGVSNSYQLLQELETNSIRFGLNDGKVTNVCSSLNDTLWAINVKKSIISAFQMSANSVNSESTVTETDISGECETVYKPKTNSFGDYIEIQKSKSINNCVQRQNTFIGTYGVNQFITKNDNIIKSNIDCIQVIENNILINIKCDESQSLMPSMINNEKPVITSKVNIRFNNKIPLMAANLNRYFTSQDLLPKTNELTQNQRSDETQVLNLLNDICAQIEDQVFPPKIIETFIQLIKSLKMQTKTKLKEIEVMVKSGEICSSNKLKDLFLDASALAASESSSHVINNAIDNQELSRIRALYMMSLIGFFSKPTEDEVKYILPLLQSKMNTNQEILLISSVIHNFCEDIENCDQISIISQTIESLIQRLRYNSNTNDMLSTIKSLENINIKTHEIAIEVLLNLAKSNLIEEEVRIASMYALKNGMNDEIIEQFMRIFKDTSETTEVRITAYKSIVMSGYVTYELLEQFLQESDPNIAIYIRTHIKNLQKSINSNILPSNIPHISQTNNNIFLASNNIQFIYSGININMDLIYQKSLQIPRTINIKSSVPVLGKELQLIEVEIRQKGFDGYVKNILHKTVNNIPMIYKEMVELFANHNSIDSDDNNFIQIIFKIADKNILIFDTRDVYSKSQIQMNVFQQLMNSLTQNLSIDRAFGTNFLNYKIQIPTISGIPLNIELYGTLVAGIKAYLNYEKELMETQIIPSIVTELSVSVYLQAANSRSGLTYKTRVSSSPHLDYSLEFKESRIFKAKLNFPKERQILLKYETEVNSFDVYGNIKQIHKNSQKNSNQCSKMSKILGISLCSEISSTEPFLSLKTSNIEISIIKFDKTMKSLELSLVTPNKRWKENKSWKLSLNTPNSRTDRKISAEFAMNSPLKGKKSARIELQTPWKSMSGMVSIVEEDNDRSIRFDVTDNGVTQMKFDASLERKLRNQEVEFTPKIKVETWGEKQVDLNGKFVMSNDPYVNDINTYSQRFRRDTNEVDSTPTVVSTNLNLKIFALDAHIKASLDKPKRTANVVVEYNLEHLPKETIELSAKFEKQVNEQTKTKSIALSLISSQFPEYNSRLNYSRTKVANKTRDVDFLLEFDEDYSGKFHINRSLIAVSGNHVAEILYKLHIHFTRVHGPILTHEILIHAFHDNQLDSNSREYNLEVSTKDFSISTENQFVAKIKVKGEKHDLIDESTHRLINITFTLSGHTVDEYPEEFHRFTKVNIEIDHTRGRRLQIRLQSPVRLLIGTITREQTPSSIDIGLQVTQERNGVTQRLVSGSLNARLEDNHFTNDIVIDYECHQTQQKLLISERYWHHLDDNRINVSALASLESTQFPEFDERFSYNLIGELRKQISDELLLAWGKGLKERVQIKREMNASVEENSAEVNESTTVIATPLDIDYVLNEHISVTGSRLEGINGAHLHIDRRDRTGRDGESDYSVSVDFHREGSQGSLNVSVAYPNEGEEYVYRRTWNHENRKELTGHVYVQWDKEKFANIDYNLKVQQKVLKRKERQTDVDVVVKYQRYGKEEPKEIRGVVNHFVVGDKKQLKFKFDSNSGAFLKGDVIARGERSSRKEFSVTYDISLSKPHVLELKVTGKERFVPKSQVSNDISIDYKWQELEKQSLKYSSRVQLIVSYTLINITARNEFKSTQFPEHNYEFDLQSFYKQYQRYLQNDLSFAWGENLADNRIHVYHENRESVPQEKVKTGKSQLNINAKPLGIEYEFVTESNQTRGENYEIINFRQETVGTNLRTNNKGVNSVVEYQNTNGSKTAIVYLSLNSPQRQWSRVTNLTIRANPDNDVDEVLFDYRLRNNRTNNYINLDVDLYRNKPSLVLLQIPQFDLIVGRVKEPSGERNVRIEFLGKESNIPYKYESNIRVNPRLRTLSYRSQTDKLISPKGSVNELVAAVYSQLLYKTRIDYEYRKRARVEVESNNYLHQTLVVYENFPSISLQSNTTKSGNNILNVNSTLSPELSYRLDVLSPQIRVLLVLDPRRRIVNFDIQNP